MIEAMKEVVDLVKQLPELSIWILCGVLIYKVIIIGSWFGIARLLIVKLHNFATSPRKIENVHKIDRYFITCDGAYDRFMACVHRLRHKRTRSPATEYIHLSDVAWLEEAIKEKEDRERKKDDK